MSFAQTSTTSINPSEPEAVSSLNNIDDFQPLTNFAVAQLIPAYKIALKKGMFEAFAGIGHIDGSKETNRGQSVYIKTSPQTDFFPVQFAYGLTDNTNISFSGKAMRTLDKVANSSYEGTSEPQFAISHTIKTNNSAININGSYSAANGPKTNNSYGITRTEGNTLTGGASGELTGGYFTRLDPVILGGEVAYLYKDSRIINRESSDIFTHKSLGINQIRIEGGNEKTLRGIIELAFPFRIGMTFGRTWVEQEEELILYQSTSTLHDSFYRNFVSGYARFQVNPRLSILPSIAYSVAPDTSYQTSKNDQEMSSQINLRYRF